jgi:TolA-binding protein
MKPLIRSVWTAPLCLAILFSLTGCLKTRAELRGDTPDSDTPQTTKPVSNPVSDVQPQGQYAMDEIKQEMVRLEGRIEDLEHAQKDQAAAQKDTTAQDAQKKLEQRITDLETAQTNMLEAINKMQQDGLAEDPSDLFKRAKAEFDAENWDGAIGDFNKFFKNPKAKEDPKDLEDATFLRGESYFKLQKYKLAIADYSEFPEKYTKSKHMPEALYKIGVSFEALGSKDDAKGFYQLLVDKFPKSSQAKKVKSKLK